MSQLLHCAEKQADESIIDKQDVKCENGIFSVEALEAMGRVSDPVVSPDGSKVLYGIGYESVEANSSNRDLYVMNVDGSESKRLTRTPKSENNAVWINGGKKIAFIYPEDGKTQIWVMNADGSDRKCVSNVENGVFGFKFSPDETKVLVISNVKYSRTAEDVYPDLSKARVVL